MDHPISEVVQCYFSWRPFKNVEETLVQCLEKASEPQAAQTSLLREMFEREHALRFPVHPDAKLKFVKAMIACIEKRDYEVDDGLYEGLVAIDRSAGSDETHFYKSYFFCSEYLLSLSESREMISHGTTGLKTWQAGEMITRWLYSNPDLVRGRKVLELGSGLGYTGISLLKLGLVDNMVVSDCHGRVIDRLSHNCKVNFTGSEVEKDDNMLVLRQSGKRMTVVDLDWNNITPEECDKLSADCILAADVVYDPDIIPCLVATIAKFLNSSALFAVVACTPRNPETLSLFQRSIEANEMNIVKKVDNLPANPDGVLFYYITRK